MIYVTGDTHGDIDYKKLLTLKEKNLSYDDYLIICGDAGICWSTQEFQHFLNLYNDIGCTIIFVVMWCLIGAQYFYMFKWCLNDN